jgi:hypothetical protein
MCKNEELRYLSALGNPTTAFPDEIPTEPSIGIALPFIFTILKPYLLLCFPARALSMAFIFARGEVKYEQSSRL